MAARRSMSHLKIKELAVFYYHALFIFLYLKFFARYN
ncbi:hypothetical protein BVRB_5g112400 isoform B [Beta vulgaris subsp. vulgaris]|nr:hypothetical protein BVRB_5g112400 isoform B [Beta vulgaris subsp. vulgaris]